MYSVLARTGIERSQCGSSTPHGCKSPHGLGPRMFKKNSILQVKREAGVQVHNPTAKFRDIRCIEYIQDIPPEPITPP
jgi:hypothetical protein